MHDLSSSVSQSSKLVNAFLYAIYNQRNELNQQADRREQGNPPIQAELPLRKAGGLLPGREGRRFTGRCAEEVFDLLPKPGQAEAACGACDDLPRRVLQALGSGHMGTVPMSLSQE